jgi:hypothetical protein
MDERVDSGPVVTLRLTGEDGNFRLNIERNCDVLMAQEMVARANVGLSGEVQQLFEARQPAAENPKNGGHHKPVHLYLPNQYRR